jgi:hypothetical protein
MLRAADLVLQNGFNHFAVIDQNDTERPYSVATSGHAETTGSAYVSGNHVNYNARTSYSPGETYTFYKPRTGLLVKAFKDKPEEVFTFDATFLRQSLRQKYRIK